MNATHPTLKDWIAEDRDRVRLFAQEQLIVAAAEHIWEKMEERGATKSDIASALHKSKAFITQILNGTRNMTLRTLSDIAFALGASVSIEFRSRSASADWTTIDRGTGNAADVVAAAPIAHHAAEVDGARVEETSVIYPYREAA